MNSKQCNLFLSISSLTPLTICCSQGSQKSQAKQTQSELWASLGGTVWHRGPDTRYHSVVPAQMLHCKSRLGGYKPSDNISRSCSSSTCGLWQTNQTRREGHLHFLHLHFQSFSKLHDMLKEKIVTKKGEDHYLVTEWGHVFQVCRRRAGRSVYPASSCTLS